MSTDHRPISYYREHDYERMRFVTHLIPPHCRLLDVGAHDGEFVRMAHDSIGADAVSVDIEPQSREVIRADGRCLPFKSRSFDVVTCLETLEHTVGQWDLGMLVQELTRVCRGWVIVSVPHEEIPLGKGHHHYFDGNKLQNLFAFNSQGASWAPNWCMDFYSEFGNGREKYYGSQKQLGRIDYRLLLAYSHLFGAKRREGPIWIVARFVRKYSG